MQRFFILALAALGALALASAPAPASIVKTAFVKHRLAGRLVDHTSNHGGDRRIWSAALGQRRDLYVYLPPGYDPNLRYPVMIWLHGVFEDERSFVQQKGLRDFDSAMASGRLPPTIIAIPDGSAKGHPTLFRGNPLWLNSQQGKFEDYVIQDVWTFVQKNYSIRPERQAHVLAGISGGGLASFRMGIKHQAEFAVVAGTHPSLNVRWIDCHGRYFSKFDPACWGWRESVDRGNEPVARFYGVVTIRMKHLVYPLFGKGPESVANISRENPIEMIDHFNLREGELAMYVAYAGRDQFNVTAQVDSFRYRAQERGLTVSFGFDPRGRHDLPTADRLRPGVIEWLAQQLAPFGPAQPR